MKKILYFMLMLRTFTVAQAQSTHYGTSAGLQGVAHSYFGYYAGNAALNTSYENSFFGTSSGRVTTTGFGNTAVGFNSLRYNTTGYWNTAIGTSAMHQNISGYRNTATGRMALYSNTEGYYNVANGYSALFSNTIGYNNTAIGSRSLYENTTGIGNTATGSLALYSNLSGSSNVGIGIGALYANLSGTANTVVGSSAMNSNTTGAYNTATGFLAMGISTTGNDNCAYGAFSLVSATGSGNSAFGTYALNSDAVVGCTGSYNSAFGMAAGPPVFQACAYNNTTALGAYALVTASNQVRIGDSNVTSIGGQVSWTSLSDGRFKREIKNDVAGLDFINQLNPVSYTFDKKALNSFLRIPDSLQRDNAEARANPRRQIGFVAQEAEALVKKSGYVFSGVEVPQNENDPYTIRYAEFVVPLVKAVQELSTQIEELKRQHMRANQPWIIMARSAREHFFIKTAPIRSQQIPRSKWTFRNPTVRPM